jgi:hypothetical protein
MVKDYIIRKIVVKIFSYILNLNNKLILKFGQDILSRPPDFQMGAG